MMCKLNLLSFIGTFASLLFLPFTRLADNAFDWGAGLFKDLAFGVTHRDVLALDKMRVIGTETAVIALAFIQFAKRALLHKRFVAGQFGEAYSAPA